MRNPDFRSQLTFLLLLVVSAPVAASEPPRTVAETSDYQATSRHADVLAFCKSLAEASPLIRLSELGVSQEGRKLPLIILADPPVATPQEAAASKKLVVFAMGNIHAGEVDGKEALLMLARDLALAKEKPLLRDLILVFAPIFNADGNEKMGNNRPSQAGPPLVGTRANADNLDLNRDFVKLESPEVRALVRLLNEWDPGVVIDCHTTNGSRHRYTLTYEGGRCPAGDPRIVRFLREDLLPDVTRRLAKGTSYDSFFYGNFSPDRMLWETVPATPRYGIHYVGLRNRIGILSESYSYASFKDRVLVSKGFVENILAYLAENKDEVQKLLAAARADTIKAGAAPQAENKVILKANNVAAGRPVAIRGFVEEQKDGRRVATDKPREYEVTYLGDTKPVFEVHRPFAYLLPASLTKVVENLQRHGIEIEEVRESTAVPVEIYRISKITRAPAFQKHQAISVDVNMRQENRRIEAGTLGVRTGQPLGNLAAYLLEPQSADGLVTWNFFDDMLGEDKDFPVLRVPAPTVLNLKRLPTKP